MCRDLESYHLLRRYIEICNSALAGADPSSPSRLIVEAGLAGRKAPVTIDIVDDRPSACGVVFVRGGAVQLAPLVDMDAQTRWVLRRRFLEEVVADPETYLHQPARLDWGWMQARKKTG